MSPTLSGPPALAPLFVKAALTGPLHRGDRLPDTVYELAPQSVDPRRLAEYDRVCGFRLGSTLPPTFLHILAFPVSVELMTQRAFPFPLIGSIHVQNRIEVLRPVGVDEPVTLTVRAADLRPHPAGRQFDLLAEAAVDGTPVWRSASTYLNRGRTDPADRPDASGDRSGTKSGTKSGAENSISTSAPVTTVRVPGDIGRRYAAVSGDRNPIHLYPLTAKAFGFRSAIAHGMWLKARTLAALEGRLPEAYTVDIAFKTPLFVPSTVALTATRADGDGWDLDVRNARSGKPHLTGTVRTAG